MDLSNIEFNDDLKLPVCKISDAQLRIQESVMRKCSGIDCKTVRIFAYSNTREQSNKRSAMRLKTESETGERR